jgi:hypothetical protein
MAVTHVKSNIVADFTGTVTVFDSLGSTQTVNATQLVRPSDWNSAHAQLMTLAGNTLGASTLSGTNIVFSGGANLTLSVNGQTLGFVGPSQSVQTQGSVLVQGSSGVLSFANANGVTFGFNASTITASHNGLTTARASNDAIGLNSALTANGVSVTANSSGLSLNFPAFLTTAAQSNHSHGNPTLALTNLSGTTASASNGLTLSLSAAAQVAQSAQTLGIYASSQTVGQSSSSTVDARSLTFRGMGVASVGMSAGEVLISVPAGGGAGDGVNALVVNGGASTASTTLTLSNSNNVSFGHAGGVITASASFAQSVQTQNMVSVQGSTGAISFGNANGITFGFNASTITASHNGLTSQSNQAVSGQNGSSTFQTLSFANSNGISFGTAAGGLTASHNALTTAAASDHSHGNPTLALTNLSGTTASNSAGLTISLSAAAGGGGGITNINVSAGTTSQNLSNIVFSNSNGVTFGLNGSTLTASAAGGGGGGGTVSQWAPFAQHGYLTTAATLGNGSVFMAPAPLFGNFSGSRADILVSLSLSSSSNSSHAGDISLYVGVYTRNGSTLSLATSASQSHRWTNTSNNSTSLVQGLRRISCPLGVNMTPGDYWVAVMTRTSTTNANWFSASLARVSFLTSPISGLIGESSNSTKQLMPGFGTWSTTSVGLPDSVAFSHIRGQGVGTTNAILPPQVQFFNFTA